MTIARGGRAIVALLVGCTVAAAVLYYPIAIACLGLTLGATYFFRDPRRKVVRKPSSLLSPVDGKVIVVRDKPESWIKLPDPFRQVGIYLSVTNVHIVRSPSDCVIQRIEHQRGGFYPARRQEAPFHNRRTVFHLKSHHGVLVLVLTAGRIVRRCVAYPRTGDTAVQGEKIALIRFGSRVDVFYPAEGYPVLATGDQTVGGQTLLASFSSESAE